MSVDCWLCIDSNPNELDAYNFCIPSNSIDFGDARDKNQEKLEIFQGQELTDKTIEHLVALTTSSCEPKAKIKFFLESNIGKKVYFVYV